MRRYLFTFLLLFVVATVQAREVFPMNEGWRFFFQDENSSDNARLISLPHTWNTDARGDSGTYLRTTANYSNHIFIPQDWVGKRLFMKFYGVQNVADLFVNGQHVGEHRGGGTAFVFEITDKLKFGSDNILMMVVSNSNQNDVLPTSTDMNIYGGIYRDVELIVTSATAVSPLYYGSDGVLVHSQTVNAERVEGEVDVYLTSKTMGGTSDLTVEMTSPDGVKAFSKTVKAKLDGKVVSVPFEIENPYLWTPKQPNIYNVTVKIEDAVMSDEVYVTTGFRSINVNPQAGFMINGKRINIRGVDLHHDNMVLGSAMLKADYDTDMTFVSKVGANAIRSAVMPHAQYLYDKCDREGVLVWIDLPFHRAPFFGDIGYYATSRFEENGRSQLREIIAQNMNHPSVVMWGLYSQLLAKGDDAIPYIKELNDLAHTMDSSRPTVACSNQDGNINFITDLIVWRQDVGWERGSTADLKVWSAILRKNWSQLCSAVNYGGQGFTGQYSFEAETSPRPNWLPERRQTKFHEEYAKNLCADSLFWGVWVNSMFDYGSARSAYGINGTGLVSFDRRDLKDAFYLYKAMWNKQQPTLHITDKRYVLRDSEIQQIKIYSSVGAPVLLVNRDTVVVRECAPCQYLSDTVKMNGRYMIKVQSGDLKDSTEVIIGNLLKQKRYSAPQRRGGLK